ncbi:sodium:calcium antiporter [Pelagibacterium flavum]|uniref:Sodium:calcium antiporter n=1 Tax=Pelagibacterium flavum TaxID=2984530 RepID=A0ABY6IU43_9HYPH|nr:sodium:calcium antiporter [Pelagibacterium sp. YIM 151497]UYQ74147.1 sodium:calcium antiporter [Pelagibacterium sp. YIM 151497]
MVDFSGFSIWINLAIFAVAAVVVWLAGARITRYSNAISEKTGIGQAAIGLLLLAGVTSLPEIGVTVTSAATGASAMAVNNLFGSIAAQVVVLVIVDLVIGRRALTSSIPDPMVILQGGLNVLLITIVAAGMVVGDFPILGIGAWAWICGAAYAFAVYILANSQGRKSWVAAQAGHVDDRLLEQQAAAEKKASKRHGQHSLRGLVWRTAGLALVILVAGYLLARTGDALASQTGLGGGAVGFILLAFGTSLPELSTTVTAAREGLYTLAVSDILGTNLINVGLVFVVDLVAQGEPVLSQADTFTIFGTLLGIAVTSLFVIGMAERQDKTVLRMGLDSAAVFVCYAAGLVVMFFLR